MVSLKVNLNNAQSCCALLMIVDNNRKKCFANLSYVCMYVCDLDGHKKSLYFRWILHVGESGEIKALYSVSKIVGLTGSNS